jgi:O-antigen ligase
MNSQAISPNTTPRADRLRGVAFVFLVLCAASSLLSVAISQIALGASLLVFLIGCAGGDRPLRTGLEWPTLLFMGWALLMIPFSDDPLDSLLHARRFYLFSALWLAATLVDSERRRLIMFVAVVLAAAVNGGYSVLTEVLQPQEYNSRIHMVQNSTMTGAWLLMAAALVIVALLMRVQSRRWRSVLVLALMPVLAAVLFSQTRSAWLGLLGGVVIIFWLTHKRYLVILAAILITATILAPDHFKDRTRSIFTNTHSTNSQRVQLWKAGLDLIKAHPLTGVGDRNLSDLTPPVYKNDANQEPVYLRHLHQNQIMMATIWGIPGLILGMWFLFKNIHLLLRRWLINRKDRIGGLYKASWTLAAIGVWVGVNIAGLFDWTFGDPEMSLVYMLCVGLALSGSKADSFT